MDYWGTRVNDGVGHQPCYRDGVELSPKASQDIINHSPDGFNFGYTGSGPAQLALALLYDVTGDSYQASKYHQGFKWEFVSGFGDEWTITSEEISAWLKAQEVMDRLVSQILENRRGE